MSLVLTCLTCLYVPADLPDAGPFTLASRSFRIPYQTDDTAGRTMREVILYVSADEGKTYEEAARGQPGTGDFKFTAPADGLYCFIVVAVDRFGRRDPADLSRAPPMLRVVVRTGGRAPPTP